MIEQAIFTSIRRTGMDGYQLASVSPGITQPDERALAQWGPAHDALCEGAAESVNFHPLPSGAMAVSRTMATTAEYSGRGGLRVYTHSLIITPQLLEKFGGNAFRIYEAALFSGRIEEQADPSAQLPAIAIAGRASVLDESLLRKLLENGNNVAVLVEAINALLMHGTAVVVNCPQSARVCAGVINLLPPAVRSRYSWTTGLSPAGQRPFALHVLPASSKQLLRSTWVQQAAMIDASSPTDIAEHPWASIIRHALKHDDLRHLKKTFQQHVECDDLEWLAAELSPSSPVA